MVSKRQKRKIILLCLIAMIILLFIAGVVLYFILFERHTPSLRFEEVSDLVGAHSNVTIYASDAQRGLRQINLSISQEGRSVTILDEHFTKKSLLAGSMRKEFSAKSIIDAKKLGLQEGDAKLLLRATDYSLSHFGKGNTQTIERQIRIDRTKPRITVLSQQHYFRRGGSGVVVYSLNERCSRSGVRVGARFFPGQRWTNDESSPYLAFISVPYDESPSVNIMVEAVDMAGNERQMGFNYRVLDSHFRKDKIHIPLSFLRRKMPEFDVDTTSKGHPDPLVNKFLVVNRAVRKANYNTIQSLVVKSTPRLLWKGAFLQLPNSMVRSRFADARDYYFKGNKIDHQVHLGLDLASIAHAKVPAANSGVVAFTGELGIYGLTVLLDHGFGLFSMYSHLSNIKVANGDSVEKGQTIGITGATGLAGGDHLHFSMLIRDIFVNPVEWLDSSWIKNNISSKLQSLLEHVPENGSKDNG